MKKQRIIELAVKGISDGDRNYQLYGTGADSDVKRKREKRESGENLIPSCLI